LLLLPTIGKLISSILAPTAGLGVVIKFSFQEYE
jgi:hypothetical protein